MNTPYLCNFSPTYQFPPVSKIYEEYNIGKKHGSKIIDEPI
jgi:hypothetical protein